MTYTTLTPEEAYVPGQNLAAYFQEVQKLRRQGQLQQAIVSLLELVDATEEDSLFTGLGVAGAYYEELAAIFRERKEYTNEIEILSRYMRQRHTFGDPRQEILKKRLERAKRSLLENGSLV